MPIKFTQSGDFNRIEEFLKKASKRDLRSILDKYGQEGVKALSASTPKDTGRTAASWYYDIEITNKGVSLTWRNNNIPKTIPIVLLIEYGHANQNGTFVEGRPFIADAIKPIFDKLSKDAWKEVTGK
jgi:hypothetical protein